MPAASTKSPTLNGLVNAISDGYSAIRITSDNDPSIYVYSFVEVE
mgnify:CR=1 FL=1